MASVVEVCRNMGLHNEEIRAIYDPQIFNHVYPENRIVRDISKDQNDLIVTGDGDIRQGVAGILADANTQMLNGLIGNFGIKDQGLPAIFSSDIDVSDAEMLTSTLTAARKEMTMDHSQTMVSTLKCVAKRKRPNGKSFIRCNQPTIRGEQYCPLHLAEGKKCHTDIRSLLIDVDNEDEELPEMNVMTGVSIIITKVIIILIFD